MENWQKDLIEIMRQADEHERQKEAQAARIALQITTFMQVVRDAFERISAFLQDQGYLIEMVFETRNAHIRVSKADGSPELFYKLAATENDPPHVNMEVAYKGQPMGEPPFTVDDVSAVASMVEAEHILNDFVKHFGAAKRSY